MAEGYLRQFAPNGVTIYSAGVETHGVNSLAIQVMQEDGIDISQHTSNNIMEFKDISFDTVITVCNNAKERCPYFPSDAKRLHKTFPDPAKAVGSSEEILIEFRNVRSLIKEYCEEFCAQL
jgi:arsenate reductase